MTIVREKSPTSFEVEQNLQTMNGARTITFESKTGRIFTMSKNVARLHATFDRRPGRTGDAVPGSFTILMIGR